MKQSGAQFSFPVHANGALQAAGTACVPVEDLGLQLGLALFETLRVEAGHAYFLGAHLARLEAGCATLELAWPGVAELRETTAQYLAAIEAQPGAPESYVLRLTLSAGAPGTRPAPFVTARQLPAAPSQDRWLWLSELSVLDDRLAALKSNNRLRYELARREAEAQGCHEALLLNPKGQVAEGSASNLFVSMEGALHTPPLDAGCLGGIVRGLLLADLAREPLSLVDGSEVPVREAPLELAQLAGAQELILSNSVRGLMPIAGLRNAAGVAPRLAGDGGPVLAALRARWARLEQLDRAQPAAGYTT